LRVSPGQGESIYLPNGDYVLEIYPSDPAVVGDYRISVHYQPTNVVAGSATRQSPVEMYGDWSDSSDVKTYQVYLTGDRRLNFMEANSTPGTTEYELSFCLTNGYDTYGCSDHREPMYIDSTEESGPSPGWWTLKVTAPRATPATPYSGSWAVYETEAGVDLFNYTNSIHTQDDFKYKLVPGEQFWLNTSGMQSYSLQLELDCSYDLWIYTKNSSPDWTYSQTNSGLKYSADDCTGGPSYLALSLDPDENGEVNFGLHLKPPPPPLTVMIGDQWVDDLSNGDPLAVNEGTHNFQVELNRPLQDGEYLDVMVTVDMYGYDSWANLEEVDPSGWMYLDSQNGTTRTFSLKVHDDGTPGQLFNDPSLSGWSSGNICFYIYHDDPNVEKSWCNDIDFDDMGSP
jgi:hypothetical protein